MAAKLEPIDMAVLAIMIVLVIWFAAMLLK